MWECFFHLLEGQCLDVVHNGTDGTGVVMIGEQVSSAWGMD
jgi:hypothetical protein